MFTLTVSDTDHVTFVKFDCIAAQPEGRFVPKAKNCCELAGAIALWSAVAVAGETFNPPKKHFVLSPQPVKKQRSNEAKLRKGLHGRTM
jgi:hypothetical protein